MVPFGEAVLLWRLHRGLTQRQLAGLAGVPQPNLSDIERGRREVSLKTIRALALALDVPAGQLVDGVPPPAQEGADALSRPALERVAAAVSEGRALKDPAERQLAGQMEALIASRMEAARGSGPRKSRLPGRKADRAWLLSQQFPPAAVRSAAERATERARKE